jgi:hypothetical protein
MTVKIDGLELKVQTSGIIHSSGEHVSFVLENEKDNPKNPVLRFVSRPASPNRANTNDFLYFCANGAIQRITFVWGSDSQKPLAWSEKLFIPRASRNSSSQSR